MRSLLQGRDTCVIMPTGGGKSLCYQLPGAMLQAQTVIVVSPIDRPDAGSGGATVANGNPGSSIEQLSCGRRTG